MSGILSSLLRFFTTPSKIEEAAPAARVSSPGTPDKAFTPIDSNLATAAWFDGKRPTARDSIDSNPDTARWYRRARSVHATGPAGHRPSLIGGGE